ncbi:hypothetical protein [Bacillus massiliglaciei]|uniref:hypothetical protein n=1 Tax=Bacillus massiliglaciei TaxID=1816693 RepID=UPI000DA63476|nr:hypothetical protein [Bacillus massiliglaciei]
MDWFIQHKEWVLTGIGAAMISVTAGIIIVKTKKGDANLQSIGGSGGHSKNAHGRDGFKIHFGGGGGRHSDE